jgi:hypothetical protein
MFDCVRDGADRDAGRNPMTSSYTEKVNRRRVEMGFKPLSDNGLATDGIRGSRETYKFVLKTLSDGKPNVLVGLLKKHKLDDKSRELERKKIFAEASKIDEPLEGLEMKKYFENEVEQCAFELFGSLLTKNKINFEMQVIKELQNLFPSISKEDAKNAFEKAENEWMEAYE